MLNDWLMKSMKEVVLVNDLIGIAIVLYIYNPEALMDNVLRLPFIILMIWFVTMMHNFGLMIKRHHDYVEAIMTIAKGMPTVKELQTEMMEKIKERYKVTKK